MDALEQLPGMELYYLGGCDLQFEILPILPPLGQASVPLLNDKDLIDHLLDLKDARWPKIRILGNYLGSPPLLKFACS